MYSYMIDIYGLPLDRTNVNGGAIALGHPLGCSECVSFFLSGRKKKKPCRSALEHNVLRGNSHTDAGVGFCSLAAGARQVATGLHEIRRRGGKVLVTSMCIGLGTPRFFPPRAQKH